jgi:UDP-N-acetylmuramate--alanine ligase
VSEADAIDLTVPTSVHVVGVGGAGMSAIATVLAGMGHRVSGSDLKESASLERLRAMGIDVAVGHTPANVSDHISYVTISTAVPAHNVEVRAATERGIPVLRRAEILAAIASTRRTVAVAGTHGKTTTASMLALVLIEAGLQPSFIIGADVNEIGTGAVWDDGELFVVEADESDGTFLELPRQAAIVTNVEPDHLEHYGSVETLVSSFERFVVETDGPVVVCADDLGAAELGARVAAHTYGTSPHARWRMTDLETGGTGSSFTLRFEGGDSFEGWSLGRLQLPVAGAHNARNACAAAVTGLLLGASFDAARAALARFAGVARRFEHRGEAAGVTFIDDYAHLPTEVAAAIEAARDGDWRRVVCVFQPHRYSRTSALWPDFAHAFDGADLLVVTDVYAAGETPRPGVSGMLVARAALDAHPWRRLAYLPHRADVIRYLTHELKAGDLCLTLGAGDLTSLPDELRAALASRSGAAA